MKAPSFPTIALRVALGLLAGAMPGALEAAAPPKLKEQPASISREIKSGTSFAPAVKAAAPSVVNLHTLRSRRPVFESLLRDRYFFGPRGFDFLDSVGRRVTSLGSGVILSADGYILSNHHVVAGAESVRVMLADAREFEARLVGSDAETDVAVLKIDAASLPAIAVADSEKLEVGDAVLAIGRPFDLGQTVAVGHVSGLARGALGVVDYEDFIQTDAVINPGNSGGALIDAGGRLVGINTAIASAIGGNQGFGFAIPANAARLVMQQIVQHGKRMRGYLGVTVQPVTADLVRELKLCSAEGVRVASVLRGSPAYEAGLRRGDVIIEIDRGTIGDGRDFRMMIAGLAPGSSVTLKIARDGEEQVLTAKLGERGARRPGRMDRFGPRRIERPAGAVFSGVAVTDLDDRARRDFAIPPAVQGALVIEVDAGSPGAEARLRPGDVIQEIDRQPVQGFEDALELSRRATDDDVVLDIWANGTSRQVPVRVTNGP